MYIHFKNIFLKVSQNKQMLTTFKIKKCARKKVSISKSKNRKNNFLRANEFLLELLRHLYC